MISAASIPTTVNSCIRTQLHHSKWKRNAGKSMSVSAGANKWIYILRMEYDKDKVDDLVLALLHLTSFREHGIVRAWKGHDWDALDRLCDKGFISDPKSKSKSVVLSDDGARKAEELFQTFCGS